MAGNMPPFSFNVIVYIFGWASTTGYSYNETTTLHSISCKNPISNFKDDKVWTTYILSALSLALYEYI